MRLSFASRTRWGIVPLAVILLTAALAADWYWSPPAPHQIACLPTNGPQTATTEPVAAPADAIKVVEKGFTQLGETSDAPRVVMLGAVLENTSSLVAYRLPVTFQIVDAAGRPIETEDPFSSENLPVRAEIPVLMPGQRIGVAGGGTPSYDEITHERATAAGFNLILGEAQWWPAEGQDPAFATVTTHINLLDENSSFMPDSFGLDFSIYSPYCEPLIRRGVVVLYRDSGGKLLGGSLVVIFRSGPPSLPNDWCETGFFNLYSISGDLPMGTDLSRAEVFVYCDFEDPPEFDPSSTTTPVN
jgi:hypothetical protein